MFQRKKFNLFLGLIFLSTISLMVSLYSQENAPTSPTISSTPDTNTSDLAPGVPTKSDISENAPPKFRIGVVLNDSYVGGSSTKSGSNDHGSLSEQLFRFECRSSIPVSDDLSVLLSAGYNRFDFSSLDATSATPQNLEIEKASVGLSYRISPQWETFGMITPSIGEVNGWGRSYFLLSGAAGANWKVNPDLSFTFGLAVNPEGVSDLPVIPLIGAHWHFEDQWTLNVGLPRTSIEYALTKELHFWAGPSFEGGSFKTGSSYGNAFGRPDLNDQKLEYREIRVALGTDYKITPAIGISAELGSAVYRDFYFRNVGYSPHSDPALYGQLGVKIGL